MVSQSHPFCPFCTPTWQYYCTKGMQSAVTTLNDTKQLTGLLDFVAPTTMAAWSRMTSSGHMAYSADRIAEEGIPPFLVPPCLPIMHPNAPISLSIRDAQCCGSSK